MKILKLFVIIALFLSIPVYSTIKFEKNWKTALEDGKTLGKRVFIDFYTDWCPPCKKLTEITFKDKNMKKYFKKENYILVKVNPEKDLEAERHFKVYSYPTLVVFNPKGIEVDRILGYRNAHDLISELDNIKKGIGTLTDLISNYKKDRNNYELIFKIVNKYIARADYPDAFLLLDNVIKMDKSNSSGKASYAIYKKGYIYYKWKKNSKAIETLLSIQKIYPKSKEAIEGFYAAYYYAKAAGKKERALEILKEFTKTYPDNKYYNKYKKELN